MTRPTAHPEGPANEDEARQTARIQEVRFRNGSIWHLVGRDTYHSYDLPAAERELREALYEDD